MLVSLGSFDTGNGNYLNTELLHVVNLSISTLVPVPRHLPISTLVPVPRHLPVHACSLFIIFKNKLFNCCEWPLNTCRKTVTKFNIFELPKNKIETQKSNARDVCL
jgi:hypothetical protein